jgi:hypothetical protein
MVKRVPFILVFLLLNSFIFSFDKERIDSPFDFMLGDDVAKIIANLGDPKIIETFDQNRRVLMFYDNARIGLWYFNRKASPLISIVIFSPSLTILNGIHVGMNFDEVRKRLGEPTNYDDTLRTYFGNSHYLVFYVNRFNQILTINWEYFLD